MECVPGLDPSVIVDSQEPTHNGSAGKLQLEQRSSPSRPSGAPSPTSPSSTSATAGRCSSPTPSTAAHPERCTPIAGRRRSRTPPRPTGSPPSRPSGSPAPSCSRLRGSTRQRSPARPGYTQGLEGRSADGDLEYGIDNADPQAEARFGSRIGSAGDVTGDGRRYRYRCLRQRRAGGLRKRRSDPGQLSQEPGAKRTSSTARTDPWCARAQHPGSRSGSNELDPGVLQRLVQPVGLAGALLDLGLALAREVSQCTDRLGRHEARAQQPGLGELAQPRRV